MNSEFQKPYQTTKEEQQLRWKYADGLITFREYRRRYKELLSEGKIIRSGKVVRE